VNSQEIRAWRFVSQSSERLGFVIATIPLPW
jgi:hypothetical protein